MTVEFAGQIKQLQTRILASGDKGGKVIIEFNIYDDALIGEMAKLVKADEEVQVTISE